MGESSRGNRPAKKTHAMISGKREGPAFQREKNRLIISRKVLRGHREKKTGVILSREKSSEGECFPLTRPILFGGRGTRKDQTEGRGTGGEKKKGPWKRKEPKGNDGSFLRQKFHQEKKGSPGERYSKKKRRAATSPK